MQRLPPGKKKKTKRREKGPQTTSRPMTGPRFLDGLGHGHGHGRGLRLPARSENSTPCGSTRRCDAF